MKVVITKEDLDQIGRAVEDGCATGPIYDQFTFDMWEKVRLVIELKVLQLEYQEVAGPEVIDLSGDFGFRNHESEAE